MAHSSSAERSPSTTRLLPDAEPLYNSTICNFYLNDLLINNGALPTERIDHNLRVDINWLRRLTGSEQSLKASVGMHPLGRIGEPGDIARVIRFLLEPENSWITGQIISADGGLASVKAG